MNSELYATLKTTMNVVSDLQAAASVLNWDQETYMPEGAAEARAEHIATLQGLAHEYLTNDASRSLAEQLRQELQTYQPATTIEQKIASVFLRDFDHAVKIPDEIVKEESRLTSLAQLAWRRARQEQNFALFAPHLEKIVDLKIRTAELLGYQEDRYNALLDMYEPKITVAKIQPVFERLRQGTISLLDKIRHAPVPNDSFLHGHYPAEQQMALSRFAAGAFGFNFERGRIDLTTHPFCTSFTHKDVRLTTRVDEQDFRVCLYSVLHETGHGLYEQGIHPDLFRTAAEGGTSMAIHESQSLFWENIIGRSPEFLEWILPELQKAFPKEFSAVSPSQLYKAVNVVNPGFIRIDADELTYNLHIILRFEIEQLLINEKIKVSDIPEVWNEKMRTSLGITPPNDALGCLQDVHWSFGGIGYFPSYTLGMLIASMLWTAMQNDIPLVREHIREGNFAPLLQWLRTHVHAAGRTETGEDILQRISGSLCTETDFLHYMSNKIQSVYDI